MVFTIVRGAELPGQRKGVGSKHYSGGRGALVRCWVLRCAWHEVELEVLAGAGRPHLFAAT